MSQPEISIIIPIYNVAQYLPQCVESTLNQSFRDFEVILIDDGSPDNSGRIADDFAGRDSRIKVVHQDNHGVGHARNAGINLASGKYVYIMDSDDYLEPDALQTLYNTATEQNADTVIAAHWVCDGSGRKEKNMSGNRAFNGDPRFLGGPAWCRLIKRRILIDHPEVRFPENIWTGQDTVFSMLLDFFVDKIVCIETPVLNYRQHDESKLHSLEKNSSKMLNAIDNTLNFWEDFISTHPEKLREHSEELAYVVSIPMVFYPYPFLFGWKMVKKHHRLFRKISNSIPHGNGKWSPFAWRFWKHGIFFPPLGLKNNTETER